MGMFYGTNNARKMHGLPLRRKTDEKPTVKNITASCEEIEDEMYDDNGSFDGDYSFYEDCAVVETIVPIEGLPEGWYWKQYNDGSGSMYSPSGKNYFEYDLFTNEYMDPLYKHWSYYDYMKFSFFEYAEERMRELLEQNLI